MHRLPSRISLFILFLTLQPLLGATQEISIKNRSISSSKQFVVFAENPNTRGRTAQLAEDLKNQFLRTLRIRDNWKHTIILNLEAPPPKGRKPPQSQLGLYASEGDQLKVQLDVFDPEYLKSDDFQADLFAAILVEYAYRSHGAQVGKSFERPAPWIVAALLELRKDFESESKAAAYASLLSSGKTPDLDDFFKTRVDRLDSTSEILFRAQSRALLEAILALPDGRPGLHAYLSRPRRASSALGDLLQLFPSLEGDRENLNRKWVLAIASESAADRSNLLSYRESANQLNKILAIKIAEDPKNPEAGNLTGAAALEAVAKSPNGKFILSQLRDQLVQLALRVHPLYKPVTDEYLLIVSELIAKPRRKMDKRIASTEEMRTGLASKSSEMDGYLDWVEATKIKTKSEKFAEVVEETEEVVTPPPRMDAVSQVLDAYSARNP